MASNKLPYLVLLGVVIVPESCGSIVENEPVSDLTMIVVEKSTPWLFPTLEDLTQSITYSCHMHQLTGVLPVLPPPLLLLLSIS